MPLIDFALSAPQYAQRVWAIIREFRDGYGGALGTTHSLGNAHRAGESIAAAN